MHGADFDVHERRLHELHTVDVREQVRAVLVLDVERRGLNVALGKPVYVVALDADENMVVIGSKNDLLAQHASLRDVRWLTGRAPAAPLAAFTKIRYNHEGAKSAVTPLPGDRATVRFVAPQFAVTPGQIAVFYVGDELVGGGWIEKS